jgi:hypothetical protein
VAQRGAGDRGGERLVHVDHVERDGVQQLLDRPRDVDRQARRAPARGRRQLGQDLATASASPRRAGVDGRRCALRSRARDSRTRSPSRGGATTGRGGRARAAAPTPVDEQVDGVRVSQAYGVTCAFVSGSDTGRSLGRRPTIVPRS